VVVIVRAGPSAGGVASAGLTVHAGRFVVNWFDVTAQLNETDPSKVPMGSRSIVAVADPPGSTPIFGVKAETDRVNCCP
jgi:hypothetical protein